MPTKGNSMLKSYMLYTLIVLCLIFSGCSRPSQPMKEFAQKVLEECDTSMEKIEKHKKHIKNGKYLDAADYNPALALVQVAAGAINDYDVRRRMYAKSLDKKQEKADKKIEEQLEQTRDAFRDCAFVILDEVKIDLPDYHLNSMFEDTPPQPDSIMDALKTSFGMEKHANPAPNSCQVYQKKAADLRKQLKINP